METIPHKTRNIILCFFVLIAFQVAGHDLALADNAGRFIVYPANNLYADSARYYLEYYYENLSALLDFTLDTTVSVYIADSDEEFRRLVTSAFPDWGAAAASLEDASIVIKSPKYIRVGKTFSELIGHELTHIMLYRASGGLWLPRWIHEGLAMKVSGEWNIGQDIVVARAVWTGRLLNLFRLEGLTEFNGAEAMLAYTQSYLAVSDLMDGKDQYFLADMLEFYEEKNDFYRAFRAVIGDDYINWTDNWYERTSMNYHFFLFIFDSRLFWIAFSLFIIFLFLMKRRQGGRIKKRWKIEDRIDPGDDSYKQYYDGYYDEENQV